MTLHNLRALFVGSCLLCSLGVAAADSSAVIDTSAGSYQGNLMINQAAGDGQQQVNARALAPGAMPNITVEQQQHGASAGPVSSSMQARISGDAFRSGNGVLGVNQGAGAANQQINGFRVGNGVRPESLDDSMLAQSAALTSLNSAAEPAEVGSRMVDIDDQAFSDSRGVVQLNQAAGVGNRMVNSLGIRILE